MPWTNAKIHLSEPLEVELHQPYLIPLEPEVSALIDQEPGPLGIVAIAFRWDGRERTADGCPVFRVVP